MNSNTSRSSFAPGSGGGNKLLNSWNNAQKVKEEKAAAEQKAKLEKEQAALANADREVYESVDHIIDTCIQEIWNEFDEDGNGDLDYDETTAFIKHTLVEMGESANYSETDFLQCFPYFKEGGAGIITQAEMAIFVKKVAGLDVQAEEAKQKEE